MHSQSIIAITPEDALSDILTHIHRSGLGNTARVLRPRRGPLREQLRRAGVPVEHAPARLDNAACLLLITAAARSPVAANIALQHGASATWTVTTTGTWTLVDDHVVTRATSPRPESTPLPPANADDAARNPGAI